MTIGVKNDLTQFWTHKICILRGIKCSTSYDIYGYDSLILGEMGLKTFIRFT